MKRFETRHSRVGWAIPALVVVVVLQGLALQRQAAEACRREQLHAEELFRLRREHREVKDRMLRTFEQGG